MIYSAPGTAFAGEEEEIQRRALALSAVADKKFIVVPVSEPLDAALWILASFRSPLAVVPLPASLPAPARERLLAQLPAGEFLFPHELMAAAVVATPKPPVKTWAVIFSSGSSGDPKAIALSGAALEASARAHGEHSGIRSGAWLLNLPLYHVGGLSVLSRAYFLGTDVGISAGRFSAEETVRWIKAGVCGLSLVPATLRRLLATAPLNVPPSLKKIYVGGAPMPAGLEESAIRAGLPVCETYGMTEHCSQIATERSPGEGALPLPGVEVRVEEGEILVRSPCLASGYFQGGTFRPLPLKDGFFATGDLGSLEQGRLRLLGRKSDLIITGGLNVYPAEIERVMQDFPGLKDFAVTGLPDKEWGETACVAVVPAPGSFDPADLRKFLRERLDHRKVPRHFVVVEEIPRSPLGKVARPALRALLEKLILPSA